MPPQPVTVDYKADRAPVKSVDEFLQLLARAVRQFHTYPAASPLCAEAVALCHRAFVALDRPDRLVLRVTPRDLVIDEAPLGAGTVVEHEIVRRLHRARVAALEIDRAMSPRDLARLCVAVIRCESAGDATTLAEMLVEQGVETIAARLSPRPEVLDVGVPPAPARDLVGLNQERRRTLAAAGPVDYLYPPEKGWVRFDPSARLETVSLVDLALLVDDPADVAGMLLRLTDDETAAGDAGGHALEQKFSDVAMLFAALDPKIARVMFAKLARAVLALEPDRRKALLRRSILPGLLDGRADGTVLRDFPDLDLAESLCLLLELETAAPEVVAAALNRLDLPDERRATVASLVDRKLRTGASAPAGDRPPVDAAVDQYARRLVRVDGGTKDFADFAAFDLSMDDHAAGAIAGVRSTLDAPEAVTSQLACLFRLVRLEPNPTLVESFLRRVLALFADLDREARWDDLAAAAARYAPLALELNDSRPDVTAAIHAVLGEHWTRPRVLALLARHEGNDSDRAIARALVEAFGPSLAPGLLALIEDADGQPAARSPVSLMCDHARLLAPALMTHLGRAGAAAARVIVRVLGFAGAGCEPAIAAQLTTADELTVRTALQSLARIGTPRAAALVAFHIQGGTPAARAAEEALWHFPAAQTTTQLRELLGRREFVVQNPELVTRLIDRASQAGTGNLDAVLAGLETLRFHVWKPELVRVALKARGLRGR